MISAVCDYDSWVMGNAVQYEATVCVVQESMRWKGNQIRDSCIVVLSGECDPTIDVQCLALLPGFEVCCLNPYVLQIWCSEQPLPACVVSAIRRQFTEEGGLYKGFEWPRFADNKKIITITNCLTV